MSFKEEFKKIQDKYGDIPGNRGAQLRRKKYRPYFLRIGRNVHIAEGCRFYYPERIVLDDYAHLNEGVIINCPGGVWIGRHAWIGSRSNICLSNYEASESELNFFEQEFNDATVRVSDNAYISNDVRIMNYTDIGDDAFIDNGVVITRGACLSNNKWFTHPRKQATGEMHQVLETEPQLLIYTQDGYYDLMRHIVSCLGLPQICIAKDGDAIPNNIASIFIVGDSGWLPEISEQAVVWTLSDGFSLLKNSDFPDSRILKYVYAGRNKPSDFNDKISQVLFWMFTRLEKTPGKLSMSELHEWLKLLSLIYLDTHKHQSILNKLLTLLKDKCPTGLNRIIDFNEALKNTQQWASNAEMLVFDRIKNKKWQFYYRSIIGLKFLKSLLQDTLRLRSLRTFKGVFKKYKLTLAALSANTVGMKLSIMQRQVIKGLNCIEQISDISNNHINGLDLLASSIYAHLNNLSVEYSRIDHILNSSDWAVPDVAFVRSKKFSSGFCYSPLTIAWIYLQARVQEPDYQLPEHAGIVIEHEQSLSWKVFENKLFYDADHKLISRSLIENWEHLHTADCPIGAQFMLDEMPYKIVTRDLEMVWIEVFKVIMFGVNKPFVRVKPWPAGYKAAISLRYDVDRSITIGRIEELVRLQAKYANAAFASWYYFKEHPDIKPQHKHLLRHWQEIGTHVELSSDAILGSGVTHHSAPTSDYWRGDMTNRQLEELGASYCEFLATSLQTPRLSLRKVERLELGEIWLTPLHFPLEGSTRDVNLHYFDKLLRYFRNVLKSGGHAIIGSHPDLNQDILIQLLGREDIKDVWFAPVGDVLNRCKNIMTYGEILVTNSDSDLVFLSKTDISDLAVEYWKPDVDLPSNFSLHLEAGKPKLLKI